MPSSRLPLLVLAAILALFGVLDLAAGEWAGVAYLLVAVGLAAEVVAVPRGDVRLRRIGQVVAGLGVGILLYDVVASAGSAFDILVPLLLAAIVLVSFYWAERRRGRA